MRRWPAAILAATLLAAGPVSPGPASSGPVSPGPVSPGPATPEGRATTPPTGAAQPDDAAIGGAATDATAQADAALADTALEDTAADGTAADDAALEGDVADDTAPTAEPDGDTAQEGAAAGDTAPAAAGAPSYRALRTIVIDPGHGGEDSGCVGVAGVAEKELTLKASRRLRELLAGRAERIILTRDDDSYPTLEERTRLANAVEADVLVSVHFNCAVNPLANGIETFFLHPDGTVPGDVVPGCEAHGPSRMVVEYGVLGDLPLMILDDLERTGATWLAAELATHVQDALVDATGRADRGVRYARFRVLRGAQMPAIVAELGFLTHADEGQALVTNALLDPLLEGLVAGLDAYDAALAAQRE